MPMDDLECRAMDAWDLLWAGLNADPCTMPESEMAELLATIAAYEGDLPALSAAE